MPENTGKVRLLRRSVDPDSHAAEREREADLTAPGCVEVRPGGASVAHRTEFDERIRQLRQAIRNAMFDLDDIGDRLASDDPEGAEKLLDEKRAALVHALRLDDKARGDA